MTTPRSPRRFGSQQPRTPRPARASRSEHQRGTAGRRFRPDWSNFEGLSNQDNFNVFGFRVNPPDPVGDVGPNHYVEMINLVFAVYSKTGTLLLGPVDTGTLWAGFAIDDCTDRPATRSCSTTSSPIAGSSPSSRRVASTTRRAANPFYNCVAISTTGDPDRRVLPVRVLRRRTSTSSGLPEVRRLDGLVRDHDREFGSDRRSYGIGVYGAREEQDGRTATRRSRGAASSSTATTRPCSPLIGDGLLPPDIDGKQKPKTDTRDPDRRDAGRRRPATARRSTR